MAWLITGGAGYIGAHVVREMRRSGREVVVLDDLSTGRLERLPDDVPLIKGAVGDRRAVRKALRGSTRITGVMHFAARKQVGESVAKPLWYWSQNVGSLQVLLEEMAAAGIDRMVFSSSAAVYGQPDFLQAAQDRITEAAPCVPINPYGATKLSGEWMVGQTAHALGWRALSLRYFNVAGAGSPELGDSAALNLIPMVFQALEEGRRPAVFGADYPTPDGTCIRDYIHVSDLATAHVAAARVVEAPRPSTSSASMRSAGERIQQAGERMQQAGERMQQAAEQAASRLPGAALAAEVAGQVPLAAEAAAEAASQAAARVVELAAMRLPGALRAAESTSGVRGQAGDIVAGMASQVGSMVARVAGMDDTPRLVDHLAVNIGTGRGYSVFEVIESLRDAVGEPFAVDIVARRAGDPAALVASPELAGRLLGWRAEHDLADMTRSAWTAWQLRDR